MMAHRVLGVAVGAALLVLAAAPPSPAQSPDVNKLQADVTTLKKDLEGVQRELQEIKSLLRERAGAPSNEFRGIVLDALLHDLPEGAWGQAGAVVHSIPV